MNNKKLLIILVALGLIFLLTQLFNQKKERSFKSELVRIDTATVTKLILNSQADAHKETILEKKDGQWVAGQGALNVPVIEGGVDGLLKELTAINVKSVATQSKERWKEYEIDDSTGSRVQVFAGNKKLVDFYSGKFGFNPQANSMISYIRIAGEPEVYAVDGFQSMSFNPSFINFRDKTIVQITPDDLSQLKIKTGNDIQVLSKTNNQWSLDDKTKVDSAIIAEYLQGLRQINGTEIVDNYQPVLPATHEMELIANGKTIAVKIFPSGDSVKPFMINSSFHPEIYFREDSAGVYNSLITGWKTLQAKWSPNK